MKQLASKLTIELNVCMLLQLEAEDPNGRTPLHYACYYSSAEVISGLCRLKTDVNHVDKKRRTPLHVVVYRKHAGVLALT